MAEKKIEKKSYGVFQDALFEKDGKGSYKPLDMAKEGMTTLKKHATQVVVICIDSSVEDVESMLKKNEIPYDKVVKMDDKLDFVVTGRDNSIQSYSWTSVLSDIGYKLSHDKEEKENDQKKTDSALEHWFSKEKAKLGECCLCGY